MFTILNEKLNNGQGSCRLYLTGKLTGLLLIASHRPL